MENASMPLSQPSFDGSRYVTRSTIDEDDRGGLDHPLTGILIVAGIFLTLTALISFLMLLFYCKSYKSQMCFRKGNHPRQLPIDINNGIIIGHDRDSRRAAEEMSNDIYFDYFGSLSDIDLDDVECSNEEIQSFPHSSQRIDIYSEVLKNPSKWQLQGEKNYHKCNKSISPKCPKHRVKQEAESTSPVKDNVSASTILSEKFDSA